MVYLYNINTKNLKKEWTIGTHINIDKIFKNMLRDTLHKRVPTVLCCLYEVLQQANLIHSRKEIRAVVAFGDGGRDC